MASGYPSAPPPPYAGNESYQQQPPQPPYSQPYSSSPYPPQGYSAQPNPNQPYASQPYPSQPPSQPPPSEPFGSQPYHYGGSEESNDFSTAGAFTERSIRAGFIRKVYSILMCQLVVTVAFIAFFLYCEPVQNYAEKHVGLFIAAVVMSFVLIIALACCESLRRKFPHNIILLSLFTLCEGFLLGVAASTYEADAVLIAAGITTAVVLAITLFSFQTKYDFTMMGGMLFVALIILILFGFLSIFFYNKIVNLIYACLGALIFSLYLVYDTQLMMGGGKQYALSPEEYIFAALNLYLDIINLFLFILRIVAAAKGD
ncbi:protein lifeguard 1-like [Dendronephthya gigantea]|uniref:protein lifeguard 1-like n=1 Tax=Dendronephthya gigantea TaxID=151771 RepID=UPI00106D40E6|nr:protein lifeguard 1-like [Dendronephthya gigantea]